MINQFFTLNKARTGLGLGNLGTPSPEEPDKWGFWASAAQVPASETLVWIEVAE